MKREELRELEQSMLKEMNMRAMLLVKLEEYLKYHKIPVNKEYIDTLPDDKLEHLVEVWAPIRQDIIRKSLGA